MSNAIKVRVEFGNDVDGTLIWFDSEHVVSDGDTVTVRFDKATLDVDRVTLRRSITLPLEVSST